MYHVQLEIACGWIISGWIKFTWSSPQRTTVRCLGVIRVACYKTLPKRLHTTVGLLSLHAAFFWTKSETQCLVLTLVWDAVKSLWWIFRHWLISHKNKALGAYPSKLLKVQRYTPGTYESVVTKTLYRQLEFEPIASFRLHAQHSYERLWNYLCHWNIM